MKGMMRLMLLLGGSGVMGYMWLRKNPNAKDKLREMGKDLSRKVYNQLNEE